MQDQFDQAEQEFFRLRGLFAVGRLSAEEFDEALKHLQVRDEEGRVWMLGANTGRWYYSTLPEWVEGEPVHFSDHAGDMVIANEAIGEESPQDSSPQLVTSPPQDWDGEDEEETAGTRRRLALAFVGIALLFLMIAGVLFSVLNADNLLLASAEMALTPTPTRIAPRAADALPTLAPQAPTATLAPTQVAAVAGTPIPVTVTPGLFIEPTSTEPALSVIPTITRNPRTTLEADSDSASEAPSNRNLPPAVYVTNVRVSPNPPSRSGAVTFTASFWNTNRDGVGMNWRVVLRSGNQDFGESPFTGITIPPGRTDFSVTYAPLNPGPCVPLQVYAVRRRDDNSREYLNGTNQGPFAKTFTFC
jgi:hypothetical protein